MKYELRLSWDDERKLREIMASNEAKGIEPEDIYGADAITITFEDRPTRKLQVYLEKEGCEFAVRALEAFTRTPHGKEDWHNNPWENVSDKEICLLYTSDAADE